MKHHTTHDTPVKLCECGCGQPAPIATKTDRAFGWIKGQPLRFINGHQCRRPLSDRFWEKVDRRAPNECWEWTASVVHSGHGLTSERGRSMYAHRVSYELHFGAIPYGMDVCHNCDNPRCVNPAHLFLGTHADNMRDMTAKGRQARGQKVATARLTEEDVRQIRKRYSAGGVTQKALAAEFMVAQPTVQAIIAGSTWAHVV